MEKANIPIHNSLSTAAYSILTEPQEPQPLLKIQPIARSGGATTWVGLNLLIDNIGDATAKSIAVVCITSPQTIALEEKGTYYADFIPPKEQPTRINLITSIEEGKISSQRIDVEVTYSNIENRRQTPIKKTYEMKDLIKKMNDEIIINRRSIF